VLATVYAGQFDATSVGIPSAASGSLGQTYEAIASLAQAGGLSQAAAAAAINAANDAFMTAMHVTCLLTAAAALIGSLVAYVGLPAKSRAVVIAHGRQQDFEAETGLQPGAAEA
jgi:hypothetical protein